MNTDANTNVEKNVEEKRFEEEPGEVDTERIAENRERESERDELLKALQEALDGSRAVRTLDEGPDIDDMDDTSDEEDDEDSDEDSRPKPKRAKRGNERGDSGNSSRNDDEIERLKAETEKLKSDLAAARADLYNFRQRAERDRIRNRKLIAEDKTAEFLPVLDNLDRALCVPEEGSAKDILTGVRMVRRQFLSVLENSGIEIIPTEGCRFDPALHDAVETEYVDDPSEEGAILFELMRGYKTPDRVLRPAQVRVGKLRS